MRVKVEYLLKILNSQTSVFNLVFHPIKDVSISLF